MTSRFWRRLHKRFSQQFIKASLGPHHTTDFDSKYYDKKILRLFDHFQPQIYQLENVKSLNAKYFKSLPWLARKTCG